MYSILLLPVCSNVSEAFMLAICARFCSYLCTVCSSVSEALMLAICVRFCSCLCKVCSHVSEALLLALQTLSLSFLTNTCNPSSDSKAFLRFYVSLHSQAPQQQYTVLFFSSMRRHGHSHKLTSSHALRYYTFLRCIDLLHSIACTTVLYCGHTFLNLS